MDVDLSSYDCLSNDCFYLLVHKYGFRNYGHWLIEMLPKLYFFKKSSFFSKNVKLLLGELPPSMKEVVLSSLSILGYSEDDVVFLKNAVYVKRCLYVSPASMHPYWLCSEINDFHKFLSCEVHKQKSGVCSFNGKFSKIFVTRRGKSNRKLANGLEIENYFSSKGFVIIDPAELSFNDQVLVFSSAFIIAGIAGAGMTNAVFARKNALVIHIVPPTMPNLFFYQLASICGHKYIEIRGRQRENQGMFSPSFYLSIEDLDKTVGGRGYAYI